MVYDTNRPPLPAPTEPSTLDSSDDAYHRTDVETNVSTRTDKTSYSIPEDGSPITINTTKPQGTLHKKFPSQTSLLIEYFEAGKAEGKARSRPSVRVRVTPSSRKKNNTTANDHIKITQTNRATRKPAYIRRISLGSRPRDELIDTRFVDSNSDGSTISELPPVEIELLPDHSDLDSSNGGRFIPMASDVSSMPPDSMLDGNPVIKPPGRRRSRSLEREAVTESMVSDMPSEIPDTLKAPKQQRSRSLSKDRITQRVMEKLQQQQAMEGAALKSKKTKDEASAARKSHRRRSKDVEDASGTDTSMLSSNADRRSGISHSARSAVSGTSSINNPKLLATVEDAIKRLILPELNALKEENRTSRNRDKFERMSRENLRDSVATFDAESTTSSRDPSRRRPSKSSSAPKLHSGKPKVVLNRHGDDPGKVLSGDSIHRERRSSRGSTSERSYADSTHEKSHRRKSSKEKSSTTSVRDAALAGLAGAGLTAAALKSHTSREEKEEERKHKKRHSSRSSRSRSASVAESVEETHVKHRVPPLPFNHSELIGSEMTRESILSADTETKGRPESRDSRSSINTGVDRSLGVETPLQEVPRGILSPAPRTPTRTPNALELHRPTVPLVMFAQLHQRATAAISRGTRKIPLPAFKPQLQPKLAPSSAPTQQHHNLRLMKTHRTVESALSKVRLATNTSLLVQVRLATGDRTIVGPPYHHLDSRSSDTSPTYPLVPWNLQQAPRRLALANGLKASLWRASDRCLVITRHRERRKSSSRRNMSKMRCTEESWRRAHRHPPVATTTACHNTPTTVQIYNTSMTKITKTKSTLRMSGRLALLQSMYTHRSQWSQRSRPCMTSPQSVFGLLLFRVRSTMFRAR
jgi:hypothetical protein